MVTTKINLNYEAMEKEMRTFAASIKSDDLVLFFFAGHGVQWEEQNFLIPCDDDRIEEGLDLKYRATYAQQFLERLSVKKPFVIVYLLDCCREYGLPTETRGMAHMKTLPDSVIFFASTPGTVAKDRLMNGLKSVFTRHLLQHIAKPGENILLMMTDVTNGVANETKGNQMPFFSSALRTKEVYLVPPEWQASHSTAAVSTMTQLSSRYSVTRRFSILLVFQFSPHFKTARSSVLRVVLLSTIH